MTGTLEPFLGPLTGIVVDAAIFLVVVATYVLYKAAVAPLVQRVFDRQGLDEHARRPLQKIVGFLVLFAGVTAAFGAVGGSCARWRRSRPRRRSRSASRSRT